MATGVTGAEALRMSTFKTDKMTGQSIANNAYKLNANAEVLARIVDLRKPIIEKVGLTLESHLNRLYILSRKAEDDSNYGPAVSAEVARGKAAGLYIEKVEHSGNVIIVASKNDEMI